MKKRFMKVCAMALAVGLFWTSVDYTVLASEANDVSNVEAGIATVSENGTGSSTTKLETPTNIKWVGWTATWNALENFDGKYSVFVYKDGSAITKFAVSTNSADVIAELKAQNIAMEDGALYSFDVWASCEGYETSDHSAMSLSQTWNAANPYPAPIVKMVKDDPMLSYSIYIPENGISGKYARQLWKDGERLEYQGGFIDANTTYSNHWGHFFNESGTYVYKFAYVDANDKNSFGEWCEIKVDYIRPATEVKGAVATWSAEKAGTLVMTIPENSCGYFARLYLLDETTGAKSHKKRAIDTTLTAGQTVEYDFAPYMDQAGKYIVEMHYVSADLNMYASSATLTTAEYNTAVKSDEVAGVVNGVVEQSKTDAPGALQTLVSQATAADLRVSMQTDANVFNQIMTLEENYKSQMNVTVGNPTVSDAAKAVLPSDLLSKVGVKGAALNMNDAGSNVALDIAVPTNKIPVDTNTYKDSVQLDIKLVGNGVAMHGLLKVPVQITIPVPSGMDVNHLTILHYYADGSGSEVIDTDAFVKNSDGTISFMVDRFSTFVIAEKASADNTTDNDDDNDDDDNDVADTAAPAKDNVPKTGDSLPIALPMTVTVAFAVAAIALRKKEM